MISIYQLKPAFQRLLSPLLHALANLGVTPNQITLSALLISMAYGVALLMPAWQTALLWGMPFVLLLRMMLNALDGMLANQTGQKTRFGALFNEFSDQLSDIGLYLPFACLPGLSAPWVIAVVIAGLLAEFAGVLAQSIGAPRGFEGPMGKSDRAFAFGVLALICASQLEQPWGNGLLIVCLLLSVWTCVNRLKRALVAAQSCTQTINLK